MACAPAEQSAEARPALLAQELSATLSSRRGAILAAADLGLPLSLIANQLHGLSGSLPSVNRRPSARSPPRSRPIRDPWIA